MVMCVQMGSEAVPVVTPEELMTGLVKAMSLTPDDYEVFAVSHTAEKVTADAGSPASCIEILLECCEANWHLSSSATNVAVSLCYVDTINNTASGSFRNLWLKRLQSLFSSKY